MSSPATISSENIAMYNALSALLEKLTHQITLIGQKVSQVNIAQNFISANTVNAISVNINQINFKLQESEKKSKSWSEKLSDASDKVIKGFSKVNGWFDNKLSLKALASSANQLQDLQQRIKGLPQLFCDSADGIYYLTQEANKARMPIQAYGDAYVDLAKNSKLMLKSPAEVTNALNAMSNALKLGTGNSEKQSSALKQLSSSFRKGKIDATAMTDFLSHLSEKTLGELAANLGISTKKLQSMAKQGKITGVQLNKALNKSAPGMQKEVDQLPMKWSDAVTKVSNRWDELIFALESRSGVITKVSNMFIKGFDLVEKAINWLIVNCGSVENALGLIASVIGLVFAGKAVAPILSFISILGKLGPVINTLKTSFGILRTVLFSVGWPIWAIIAAVLALVDAYHWIKGEESVIGSLIGPWDKYLASLKDIFASVELIFSGFITSAKGLGEIISGLFTLDKDKIQAGFEQLCSGILNIVDGFKESIRGAINYFIEPLKSIGPGILGFLGYSDTQSEESNLQQDSPKTEPGKPALNPKARILAEKLTESNQGIAQLTKNENFGVPVLSTKAVAGVTNNSSNNIVSNQKIDVHVTANSPQELTRSVTKAVIKGANESQANLINEVNRGLN
ncbi:tape measure protein [Budviciaceae bacterium BWR-B9]|uniref:Tape measure protein n=1 Tax=Limnobaculum allomyrinae TaxID=2791986 RepID=A0ABS1IQ09_9GAMM|nr:MULTISPECIES: tape measure protein [Limnobaculum]MBK5143380.1 tape measure protein [Limnobaculum allomyrinae]MBV7691268.1 tape measure protein [Limnobaculum sp. M2-1]